ncbi:MAG: VWA domain-containing protein [Acidobacteriia bacterium]|nr:VWA domain-containing protein [Terriglobia bacterium]
MMRRAPAFLVVFVLAAALSVTAQITISVKREEVRIDVLVTDRGKPVPGLKLADFEVLDNGVRQQIEFAKLEEIPINAILVLDMSQSVAGELLDNLRNAGHVFLDELRKDDRAALVTFSHVVALGSTLTSDPGRVEAALSSVRPFGRTSLIDASYAGLIVGKTDFGCPLVVVFSDGLDTSSWLTGDAVLDTPKRSDAVVYAVSAGRLPNMTFLRDLTGLTGGSLLEVESTKNLSAVFLSILEEFRQRYLVTYEPSGVSREGWHNLKVRIKGRKFSIRARPGYLVGR